MLRRTNPQISRFRRAQRRVCCWVQLKNVSTVSDIEKQYLKQTDSDKVFRLLDSSYFLLPLLGSKFPLDVAIGMNGRVWINSEEPKHVIVAVRCIERADPEGGSLDEKSVSVFLDTLDV